PSKSVNRGYSLYLTKSMEKEEHRTCVVCCEVIDDVSRLQTVGACNHDGACSLCYLRLRRLMGEYDCILCKTRMERMMVCTTQQLKPFQDFEMWGDNAGPGYVYDDEACMFIPQDYFETHVRLLDAPHCQQENCGHKCANRKALQAHLRQKHQKYFCAVCLEHKKVFLSEQQMFGQQELELHVRKGDPACGFLGHPRCEFCKTRHYDKQALYEHLTKKHFSCHICEERGERHKYFRDYRDLEAHFGNDHFLCEEQECLEKKFVVFADAIEMKAHMLNHHPHINTSTKIEVNFTVRRGNEEAKAETHESQGNDEGALREFIYNDAGSPDDNAAAIANAFPSLRGEAVRQMAGWVGRSSAGGASGAPRAEDFPSLRAQAATVGGAAAAGGASQDSLSFRAATLAYPTPAMAAASSSDGWSYPEVKLDVGASAGYIGHMRIKAAKKKGKKGRGPPPPPPPPPQQQQQQQGRALEERHPVGSIGRSASPPTQQVTPVQVPAPSQNQNHTSQPLQPPPFTDVAGGGGGGPMDPAALMARLKEALGEDGLARLRVLSSDYRLDKLSGAEYFHACKGVLPEDQFCNMLEDLVTTLPDEQKRHELALLLKTERTVRENKARLQREGWGISVPPAAPAGQPQPQGTAATTGPPPPPAVAVAASVAAPNDFPAPPTAVSAGRRHGQGTTGASSADRVPKAKQKKPRPGSGATYLTQMGVSSSGIQGKTGISIVKGGRSGSAEKAAAIAEKLQAPPPGSRRAMLGAMASAGRLAPEQSGQSQAQALNRARGTPGLETATRGARSGRNRSLNAQDFPGLPKAARASVQPAPGPVYPGGAAGASGSYTSPSTGEGGKKKGKKQGKKGNSKALQQLAFGFS
ncbi:unnamed protein product, partial [Chrysoparadoxa australica]